MLGLWQVSIFTTNMNEPTRTWYLPSSYAVMRSDTKRQQDFLSIVWKCCTIDESFQYEIPWPAEVERGMVGCVVVGAYRGLLVRVSNFEPRSQYSRTAL
jgi:hypothetical protein